MTLSKPMMNALLGAIAQSTETKPNDAEIDQTLEQLADAAAAICRAVRHGASDRFIMRFQQQMERRITPNDPQPQEEE